MSTFRTFAALALIASFATGCDRGTEPNWVDDYYSYGDGTVEARMTGDMPLLVDSFDDQTRGGYLYTDGTFLDLQMEAYGEYGWAMLLVSAYMDDDGNVIEGSESVIGCSGPEDGYAEFDEGTEDSEVTIDRKEVDGEDSYDIRVRATFLGTDTVVATGTATVSTETMYY